MIRPEISFVLPVFRERAHIRQVLSQLVELAVQNRWNWEIVVVDDGSDDGTWEELVLAHAEIDNLKIIRFSRNFGKEFALCAGLDAAEGMAAMFLDSDLQHPPEMIPQFVRAWKEGYLVVEGVKVSRGQEGFFYSIFAKSFYRMLSAATRIDFRGGSDFKLLDRVVIDAWKKLPEKNVFFRGMVSWVGFPKKQIPFSVADRASGQSSFGALASFRLAWSALSAYSAWPLHVITGLGLVFTLISTIILVQTLLNKFLGTASTGFTTVITLQLMIGSVLILSIGVLGEYLAKIFEEVKQRPRYLIFETKEKRIRNE